MVFMISCLTFYRVLPLNNRILILQKRGQMLSLRNIFQETLQNPLALPVLQVEEPQQELLTQMELRK